MLLSLLVSAGCVQGTLFIDTDTPAPGGDDSAAPDTTEHLPGTDDTGDTTDATDTDTEPTWPKECPDLYDPDVIPTFELEFTGAELENLRSDCAAGSQRYHPVTFTYDGESVAAMARLKGNWSWNCDKYQFVVSFNEEDPTGRFHGVRKVMLDAPWYDHTLLHERLAFPLFADRGLPYSCVNNAKLYVNGEYYGLYANVERIDREYLERHFEEPDGNLYQAGTELKTNEDVGDTTNLAALNAAQTVEEIAALMDLDQAVAEWATEAMLPAMDNYWAGVEINYYLYDHPSRGFVYLPYDLDITFGDAAYPGGDLVWPDALRSDPITYEHPGWRKEELVKRVLADPAWCDRFVEELVLSRAAFSPEELTRLLDEWDAQISGALEDDPRKSYSNAEHDAAVASLRGFFQDRADYVDTWLARGGHCPARF